MDFKFDTSKYSPIRRKSDGQNYAVVIDQEAKQVNSDSFEPIYKCHPIKKDGSLNMEQMILIKRSDMKPIKTE